MHNLFCPQIQTNSYCLHYFCFTNLQEKQKPWVLNHLPLREIQLGFYKPHITLLLLNQYLTLSYLNFSLKTPYLIYIFLLINTKLSSSIITHTEWIHIQHMYFFLRHAIALFPLEIIGSISTLHLGITSNNEISNKRHKNMQNMALKDHVKNSFLHYES